MKCIWAEDAGVILLVSDRFFRRLRQVVELSSDQEALLDQLLGGPLSLPPHHVLAQQGSVPKDINLVLDGIAYLRRSIAGGREVISGLLLPGDLCCTNMEVSRRATHGVMTLTRCSVIKISQTTFDRIEHELPHIVRGLWRLALAEQGIAREWFVNVASRPANKRMAHLFCEIITRFQAVGLAEDGICSLPLTQSALADILGMSAVHANRTIQDLRATGMVKFDGQHLEVHDIPGLKAFCRFSSDYLLLSVG